MREKVNQGSKSEVRGAEKFLLEIDATKAQDGRCLRRKELRQKMW